MSRQPKDNRPVIVDAGVDGWLLWVDDLGPLSQFLANGKIKDQNGDPIEPGHARGWGICKSRPTQLTYISQKTLSTEYRLKNPDLHEISPTRWPMVRDSLTDSSWEDIPEADDYKRHSETEEVTNVIELADVIEIKSANGKGMPDTFWRQRWKPALVPSVLHQPELHPFIPGRLDGFRAHIADLMEARPEVSDVYCAGPNRSSFEPGDGPKFRVRQLWEPARTTKRKATPRSRTKMVEVQTWATVEVSLKPVPEHITGVDIHDAIAKWEQAEAGWLENFDMIGAKACGTCDGKGWVRTG